MATRRLRLELDTKKLTPLHAAAAYAAAAAAGTINRFSRIPKAIFWQLYQSEVKRDGEESLTLPMWRDKQHARAYLFLAFLGFTFYLSLGCVVGLIGKHVLLALDSFFAWQSSTGWAKFLRRTVVSFGAGTGCVIGTMFGIYFLMDRLETWLQGKAEVANMINNTFPCGWMYSAGIWTALTYIFRIRNHEKFINIKDNCDISFWVIWLIANATCTAAILSAPGYCREEDYTKRKAKLTGPRRWCAQCDSYVALRSKHCRDCQCCVARFDHHCPLMYNCVGRDNYCKYLTAMLGLSLWYFYLIGMCDIVFRHSTPVPAATGPGAKWLQPWLPDPTRVTSVPRLIFETVLMVPDEPFLAFQSLHAMLNLVWIFALLSVHSALICFNLTTWEFLKYRKIAYLHDPRDGSFLNPFDRCCVLNWFQVVFNCPLAMDTELRSRLEFLLDKTDRDFQIIEHDDQHV